MLLRSFPQFNAMDASHMAAMADLAEERYFPAGSEMYRENEPVREIHYVLSGAVELRRNGQLLRLLRARCVVGGLTALAGGTSSPQVIAVEDTTTFSFSQEDQLDLFEDNFELLVAVIRGVAGAYLEARRASGSSAGFSDETVSAPMPSRPLSLVEKVAVLRRSGPYSEARLEPVAELAREASEVRFPAGEPIWRTGDPSGFSLLIVAGIIEANAEEAGQRFRFSTGSVVGGLDTMAGRPRWFDAVAVTDVVALEVQHGTLLDLFEDHIEMAMDLLRGLATGVLALREQLAREQDPP